MIYLKNIREKQTVHIPRTEINSKVVAVKSYDEGYADGIVEGKKLQKKKLTDLTVSENGVYKREDGWDMVKVNVSDIPSKTQEKTLYISKDIDVVLPDEGYDGLSKVNVNATQYGQNKRNEGYADGYTEGYEDGIAEGGQIDVDDTQVMNITANGIYTTKYSEPNEANAQVTGYFDDNTPFYGYAHLTNHTIATGIIPTKTSKVELWWRPDFNSSGSFQYIFANTSVVLNGIYLKVDGDKFSVKFGNYTKNNQLEVEDKWYHIVVSTDGLVIDGETITTLGTPTLFMAGTGLFINGDGVTTVGNVCANGYFGMVKIDGKTFIPTEDGFIDYTTDTILTVYKEGEYDYEKPTYDGNLIRTVHVNVPQNTLKTQNKILTVTKDLEVVYPDSGYNALAEVSVDATQYGKQKRDEGYDEGYQDGNKNIILKDTNIKLSHSTFTEVPEHIDFKGVVDFSNMFSECMSLTNVRLIDTSSATDMSYMFKNCQYLTHIECFDTHNVVNMRSMFSNCYSLIDIPEFDTSNVTDMSNTFSKTSITTIPNLDTSKVENMSFMFGMSVYLETIPSIDTSNVTDFNYMFSNCAIKSIPHLDLFGDGIHGRSCRGMFEYCIYLTTIPALTFAQVFDIDELFYGCKSLTSIPRMRVPNLMSRVNDLFGDEDLLNLTDIGGFVDLKVSIEDDNGLARCPNLTYDSCMNILNGLYDFIGNGEEINPTEQGRLRVHQNFLNLVGDQISIGVKKGWQIIA